MREGCIFRPSESAFRECARLSDRDVPPANASLQKNWSGPVSDATLRRLLSDSDATEQARLLSFQGADAGAWLNAFPSANVGLKMSDMHIRIAVALRLGSKVCEPHACVLWRARLRRR